MRIIRDIVFKNVIMISNAMKTLNMESLIDWWVMLFDRKPLKKYSIITNNRPWYPAPKGLKALFLAQVLFTFCCAF